MVARAVRRAFPALAAVAAIGYLVVMVVTGALPQSRQRVQFEAKGVMALAPERIVRVDLVRGSDRAALVRDAGGAWTRQGGGALDAPLAAKLALAVQYMHTAAPVRVLTPAELAGADARAFGLDRPALAVGLYAASGPVLSARFGARNPDDMLQYMAIDGRTDVVLMSRFVGEEWRAVAEGVLGAR
jgi:hypothetical protein